MWQVPASSGGTFGGKNRYSPCLRWAKKLWPEPLYWYRGATAEYDAQSVTEIEKLGYGIAGFSVNADSGATLGKLAIEQRLKNVKDGDIIIAHMNKPDSDSAQGLSVGLIQLLKSSFHFVRLDQIKLQETPSR